MSRPNIVYVHAHDAGRYISPYGYDMPTPNMQKLAEQGVTFRKAFCAGPTCSASRAGLVTGRWAHSSGMIGLAHRGFRLNDYKQHIAHTLKNAGYYTELIGFQHVGQDRSILGYDRYDRPEHGDRYWGVIPRVREFFSQRYTPDKPFFLSIGVTDPHRDWVEDSAHADPRYVMPPAPLPDTPETRADYAGLKNRMKQFDLSVGTLMECLAENGLEENTLVICTTDHGLAFPQMKCNLTDHGIGVLLLMRGPGVFTGGKVLDGIVSQIDIFPTLCEWLDIDRPDWLQGVSFLPMARGAAGSVRKELFADVTYHAAYEPMRCVRTRRYKYIRRFDQRETPVLPNCDDSPTKTLFMAAGWDQRTPAMEQLYDLTLDPVEVNNLIDDPAYADVVKDLRSRLDRHMQETGDPLLNGPVPAPKGAQVNDVDGLSPQEPCITIE
ncbi:MAG: sulfatase [Phycisphaerae bacterium]